MPEVFAADGSAVYCEVDSDVVVAERVGAGGTRAGPAVLSDFADAFGAGGQAGELVRAGAAGERGHLAGVVDAVIVLIDVDLPAGQQRLGGLAGAVVDGVVEEGAGDRAAASLLH